MTKLKLPKLGEKFMILSLFPFPIFSYKLRNYFTKYYEEENLNYLCSTISASRDMSKKVESNLGK